MKKFIALLTAVCALAACACFTACQKTEERRSSYSISAVYDGKNATLEGTVQFDYYNSTDNEITDLKFNLYGNAFRKDAAFKPVSDAYAQRAYYDGESYGGMSITSVTGCADWTVCGEDQNVLSVNLANPVYPEQRAAVSIEYTLTLAKVNHRTGVAQNAVNLGNFYPVLCAYTKQGYIECPYYSCGDPFVSDCADYVVSIEFPQSFICAASGRLTEEKIENGKKTCTYALNNARDFALVLSENFKTATKNAGGTEVIYYYISDANAQATLDCAAHSLEYFSQTFGEYIYPVYSVVQTGFCYGGMEYPALSIISSSLDAANTVYTAVHETAHQWWYAMVGSNQLTDGWQDEGLTEYSALCFFENSPEYGFTRTGLINTAKLTYRAFFTVYNQLNGQTDTRMHRNLSEYDGDLEYCNVSYNKGLILFETLRDTLGDKKFFTALKVYFKQNCGKIASAEELFGCFINQSAETEALLNAFADGRIII